MELGYFSLQDAIAKMKMENPVPKFKSQRAELFNDLYSFYEKDYKKQKWKEYISWLKKNRKKHTKEAIAEFRLVSYPKISIRSFCSFWLGHIPTDDLYYLVSIARDCDNRGISFNKWLFWALKVRKD